VVVAVIVQVPDVREAGGIDPCSSALWLDGFVQAVLPASAFSVAPVVPARTWLLSVGYRRYRGRISVNEGAWKRDSSMAGPDPSWSSR
jgi:hypothetical protein